MFFLNRTTELQCSTNSVEPIGWSFTSAGSHFVYIILFIHDNFTTYGDEKYKIDRSITGQYNLVIESADFSYAGKYKCTEGSFGPEVEAELVVIGSTTASKGLSSAMIVLMIVVMFICLTIIIVVLFSCRAYVKAWTTKHRALIADSEPDVVRSDPMTQDNHYYEIEDLSNEGAIALTVTSTDDRVAQQAESAFSVYELIRGEDNETTTDSLSPSQQVHTPAYSRVNKDDRRQERRNRETQMAPSQTPVYSEITKTNDTVLSTHQGSNTSDLVSTTRAADTTQTNYFGSDGTEYTRVNSFGERPVAPTPNSSKFHPVEKYAMIDHTRRAPPPLPRL